jgi:hypothetical protein
MMSGYYDSLEIDEFWTYAEKKKNKVTQEMIREYTEHQFEHGDKSHFKIEDEKPGDEFQS